MSRENKYSEGVSEDRLNELKESAVSLIKKGGGKAFSEEEMVETLGLTGKDIGTFVSCLDELESFGSIIRNRKGKYLMPDAVSAVSGVLNVAKKGYGFLVADDGSEDVFIPKRDLNGALNGDRILARIEEEDNEGKRRKGTVYRILKRSLSEVTGVFIPQKRFAFVVSEDRRVDDVFVPLEDWNGAEAGDKVRAVITKYPENGLGLRGKIAEIYGKAGDSKAELAAVCRRYGIADVFSDEVIAEAERIDQNSVDREAASEKRVDLRDEKIITIDGADAKDLDDAVSVKMAENGNYILGVHIADVSHYVREKSALDKEALSRGCSVYLLDTVVPMLPKQLSNGICSLNEGEDRLTLSVEMEIDSTGDVVNYRIFESVIRSSARMVYSDVSDIIENEDAELIEKYSDIYEMICRMDELAKILRTKRQEGGSLDFDVDESYIELDSEGVPIDIRPSERRVANRIIEEFMLTANKVVAEHHYWMEIPFVYRVHEKPDPEKMEDFKRFAGTLGYSLKGSMDNVHPKSLREILVSAEGSDAESIVNRVMLKSMKKADYQPECDGHFGLGFTYYCHFTSPIRRYPDLMIHRIIKEVLHGGMTDARLQHYAEITPDVSEISSAQERLSVDAERTVEKKKKAQFMRNHIGESFEGIISGVLNSGFFVELPNTIEGYVPIETLDDDYYTLDADNYRIIGERTSNVLSVGDRVKITVDTVSPATDEIDFRLVREGRRKSSGKRRKKDSIEEQLELSGLNRKERRKIRFADERKRRKSHGKSSKRKSRS